MSDDLDLVKKDDWVLRILGFDTKRKLDALNIDVPSNFTGPPTRDAMTAQIAEVLTGDIKKLQQVLTSAPQAEVPGRTELGAGLDALLDELAKPNPPVSDIKRRLDPLKPAVPAMVKAMAAALLLAERGRLVATGAKLIADLPDMGINTKNALPPLQKAVDAIGTAMPEAAITGPAVTEGKRLLGVAQELAAALSKTLLEMKQRRDTLAKRLSDAGLRIGTLPADDVPEVGNAATAMANAELAIKVMAILTQSAFEAIEGKVKLAEDAATKAEAAVKILADRQSLLDARLKAAATPGDALADSKLALDTQRGVAAKALAAPLSKGRLDLAEQEIAKLEQQIAAVQTEGADLGGADGLDTLLKAFGDQAALDKAFGGRTKLRSLAQAIGAKELVALAGELGGGDMAKGVKPLADLAQAFGAATLPALSKSIGPDKLAALAAEPGGAKGVKALCDAFTPALLGAVMKDASDVAGPKALLDAFGKDVAPLQRLAKDGGFGGKPAAFAAFIEGGCDGDPKTFAKLARGLGTKTDLPRLKALLEGGGLGDAPAALGGLVGVGCGGDPAEFKAMLAGLDSDKARADLKRVLDKGGLPGKSAQDGTVLIDPDCLGYLLRDGHTAEPPTPDAAARCASMTKLLAGLDDDACGKLAGVLEQGGLGAAPAAFAGLAGAGCDADPAKLKQVLTTFGDGPSQAALKQALTSGGLAGKFDGDGDALIDPNCLGHLLRDGQPKQTPPPSFAGRSAGLATLLKGLDGPACTKLEGVLSEGGLGQAPRGLASLVGIGCDGKPADLKTLLGTFDDAPSRAALKQAVLVGGLAGREEEDDTPLIDPSCLAHILKNGHKEPTPPAAPPNLATRCTGMKTLLLGLDEDACTNLDGLLQEGGLGKAPDLVGHMVGLGCGGDPAKLAALADEFDTDASRIGLTKLIETGGFGATKADGTASGVSPECLGRLLGTGCEGKPDELSKLVKALGNADRISLEKVMSDGELGKHPKVLAKLYKFGCLDNPAGADGGAKNPQVLKDMVGEFNVAGGPAGFKDMLTTGGMGDANKEDRLGSVVRHAFVPKPPAVQKQNAKQLKKLQASFQGHMADLKTTVEALEAAPDTILKRNSPAEPSNQPGKGLRNVINAPKFAGNPTNLRTGFFDVIKNRTAGAVPGNSQRRTQAELMQNAASFEHAPKDGEARTVIRGFSVRTGHVKVRHTRKYSNVTPTVTNGHGNKTTLYPRKDDPDQDVTERVSHALNTTPNVRPETDDDIYNFNGGTFMQTHHNPDGKGAPSLMGYAAEGADAALTQFAPEEGGAGCVTIYYDDMDAIKRALK